MRNTLSVLTATCLLALSQPAWTSSFDPELQQRARIAALALPASDRRCAAALLLTLPGQASRQGRALASNRICAALAQVLHKYGSTGLHQHQLPTLMTGLHWIKAQPQDCCTRFHIEWASPTFAQQAVAEQLHSMDALI